MTVLKNRLKKLEANQPRQIMSLPMGYFYGEEVAQEPVTRPMSLDEFYGRYGSRKTDAELMAACPNLKIYR